MRYVDHVAYDVHETSASSSQSSIHLIDLTEGEQEAPFAVREADGSVNAVSGRIPDRAELLAWLEDHPVFVGIATGVLCFSIIAGAMTAVLGDSDAGTDDPVAGAALSETDGSQGSFSSSGSGGANFTSDDSKLSRSGAGKIADEAGGETAAGASTNPGSPTAQDSFAPDATTAGASNLDQSATINGGTPPAGNGSGQSSGRGSSTTQPAVANPGLNSGANPTGSPTTAATGNTATTLNPGPNVSGTIPTTVTTTRATTSTPATNPTTVTTGQTPTTPTTPTTTPTTAAVDLFIAAPGDGTSHLFETPTDFAATFVSGATQYCWTFIQSGVTALEVCSGGTTYQLPARPAGIGPGLVTVRATATGPFGSVSDTIQISLNRSRIINNPLRDVQIGSAPMRVGVINLIGATSYCFRITQTGYDSGQLCYPVPGKTFPRNDPIWDLLSPGPLTVTATVYAGGMVLATDSVSINLLAP